MDSAFSSLVVPAQPADIEYVTDDPFEALLEELRAMLPYRGVSAAAREMGISVGHLHNVLVGRSDASAEVRQKIARYVATHRKTVTPPSELGVDLSKPGGTMTTPAPVSGEPAMQEVTVIVPTPYHAALCNLLSTLPVPVILQMIPEAVRRAEEERQKHAAPSEPPPTPEK